jgi:hypothetical protein
MSNDENIKPDEDTKPDAVQPKPDTGWTMIPPLGTPHNPQPDPEFTLPTGPTEPAE